MCCGTVPFLVPDLLGNREQSAGVIHGDLLACSLSPAIYTPGRIACQFGLPVCGPEETVAVRECLKALGYRSTMSASSEEDWQQQQEQSNEVLTKTYLATASY